MKARSLVAIGLLSLTAYKIYQKHHNLKKFWNMCKNSKEAIQSDINEIQTDLAVIQHQGRVIQNISKDLTYNWRGFSQETQAQLTEIQDRIIKFQRDSDAAI
ncbi:chemotaxis protein [Streptococcus castoreus]|uniref:hypothetical protein n=1 Tax=Streptococcus castoreus TaxID=254786 RepID=UPI00040DE63D|nr:hypothetical protein [Streptococcus castoreus]